MLGKSLKLCCTCLKRNSQSTPPLSHNPQTAPSMKNFNSLYDCSTHSRSGSDTLTGFGSGSTSQTLTSIEDDVSSDSEPDLSCVFAARRLTRPASTGRSNSIVEENNNHDVNNSWAGFGAVPTMSPDPYMDFKKSMEEMVDALGILESEARQVRLQELLLCYLALNSKNAHKYIVGAFTDVLRALGVGN